MRMFEIFTIPKWKIPTKPQLGLENQIYPRKKLSEFSLPQFLKSLAILFKISPVSWKILLIFLKVFEVKPEIWTVKKCFEETWNTVTRGVLDSPRFPRTRTMHRTAASFRACAVSRADTTPLPGNAESSGSRFSQI